MMQVLVILVFMAVYLRDEVHGPLLRQALKNPGDIQVAAWSIGSMFAVWLFAHIIVVLQGSVVDRRGHYGAVRRAEHAVFASRIVAVGLHAFNVLGLGWLDAVRSFTGDIVAIDEALACLPVLGLLVAGWWSIYPVERRLRDAVILRELDEGRSVPHLPPRGVWVVTSIRHQMAIIVLPIVGILIWNELIDRGESRKLLPTWVSGFGAHFVGLAIILTLMPVAMRRVWDTVALGPGPLRDQLLGMCQAQKIRVRELLLWNTHGAMINGAVMGLIAPFRYILLTDALIESLPPRQVEAVTAHELGHVRRRHMIWLAAAAIGSITVLSAGLDIGLTVLNPAWAESNFAQGVIAIGSLGAALVIFGFVSRRFEWQADAFAAQHLSGHRPGSTRGIVVSPEAAEAMIGALESVAVLNQIPRKKFSWRHGSIDTRQKKLAALIGRRTDRLPIDRQASVLAVLAAVVGLLAAGLIWYSGVSSEESTRHVAAE